VIVRDLVYVVQMVLGLAQQIPVARDQIVGMVHVDHDSPSRMFLLLILEEALPRQWQLKCGPRLGRPGIWVT
jgi:hypothetical protein